jgi:Neutral/alkaline non-lysosomal ceramidase, N-terminal/Neutral/alkaline non-lysosomal ceramidase, C-terminal
MPSDAAIPARFTNACICVCMPGALQYASYVTTREEYAVQRYEGASTLFGPATLDAYIHVTLQLVRAMLAGEAVPSGPTPPDLLVRQIGLLPPVVMDAVPHGAAFGDVVAQLRATRQATQLRQCSGLAVPATTSDEGGASWQCSAATPVVCGMMWPVMQSGRRRCFGSGTPS